MIRYIFFQQNTLLTRPSKTYRACIVRISWQVAVFNICTVFITTLLHTASMFFLKVYRLLLFFRINIQIEEISYRAINVYEIQTQSRVDYEKM